MRKIKTFVLAILLGICALSNAKPIILTSPQDYYLISISPNGKWACGYYLDYSNQEYGFLWNLESGNIELLSTSEASTAYSVSNNGVVAGTFADNSRSSSGLFVQMPGYYKDGKWHSVDLPEGVESDDGVGYGISTDGHYMSGSLLINGKYNPFIWKDGKIYRTLAYNDHAMPYCISPDGQAAAGWEYGPVHHNRIATYWAPDGKRTHLSDYESPWSAGQQFSPDGKKLLFWGGWDSEAAARDESILLCVYDLATGEITKLPTLVPNGEMEVYAISNKGTIVGGESKMGYINVDGQGYYVKDYLADKHGVDFSTIGIYPYDDGSPAIESVRGISEDDGVIGLSYYDLQGAPCTMIVILNRDTEHLAPSGVKAEQMQDIAATKITWHVPIGATNIKGYNVYRGSDKVNADLITSTTYYDANLAYGDYSYTVAAVNTDGTETKAEAVTVTISPKEVSQPQLVFSRQKGMNSAMMMWETPLSNLINKSYTNINTATIQSFGANPGSGVKSFEAGIKFHKAEMACYAGCKLTDVAFYPMSEQDGWTINIYSSDDNGTLSLIASKNVTQPLSYKERNIVKLDEPVALPDADLIIAVEVKVKEETINIFGIDFGNKNAGTGDLIRRATEGEPDFYSIYDMSASTGYPTSQTWLIDAILTPDGTSDDVDVMAHYDIYKDGSKVGETSDTAYELAGLANGTHSLGVAAVFANGKVSEQATSSVNIVERPVAVRQLQITSASKTESTFTWTAPVDEDKTELTYASGSPKSYAPLPPEGYSIAASIVYKPSMIKGYNGYQVKTFKFYPLQDAVYTFYLMKDEKVVSELEVEDYEVNQWNTVELKTPVTIDEKASYRLVLDCYDAPANTAPLAIDQNKYLDLFSNLYTLDDITAGDVSWSPYSYEGIMDGNWMIGMEIVNPEGKTLSVDGYDICIDGKKKNTEKLSETSFTYNFGTEDAMQHTARVDVYYPAKSNSVWGDITYFYLGTTGISDAAIATLQLQRGENYLKAMGEGIEAIEAYATNGMRIASANGDTLNLDGISAGVYVVKVKTATGDITRKISIK